MNKPLVAAAVTTAVGVATVASLGVANAATTNGTTGTTTTSSTNSTKTDPMSGLIDALVSKFNLKKSDVQAVFDAQRTKMDAQREADAKAELAQLVKDGKLTQAQADAITAKRAELDKQRDADRTAMDSKTDTERRAAMDAKRTELDTWLKDQGIDTQYAYLLMGGRGHGGPGGRGSMHGDRDGNSQSNSSDNTTTSTTSSTNSN